jgi:signal transduction histidine kinase
LRFRYRLQGFDDDWIEAHTSQRAATYTNLRPATYRFEVQAAGRDGVWKPGAHILTVTLAPEWSELWWVLPALVTTCGGLGLALLAGGFQTRLRQSKRQNQMLEQQVTERTTELSMLLAVSRSITSEHDLGPLLIHILNDVHATLAHTGSLVLLYNDSEANVIAYRLLQNEATLTESRVPKSLMTPLLDALHSGKPFVLCDVPGAAALAPLLPAPQQTSVWLGALLHARAEIIGVLLLFDHAPGRFDAALQPSLQRFANQVAIAVDNARLYAESQQLAVEIERGRLSRELHDSVTQFLHSISLHADASTRALALGKPEVSADNMREVQRLARAAIHELRTLIFDLRSSEMQERGLGVALQAYLDNVVMRGGLVVKREIDYPKRLPETIEFEVYRIAQEVLTNVAKHAHASSVTVVLSEETTAQGEQRVRLEIADNGAGFDVQRVRNGAIGLNSMAERAQQIGAHLTIQSAPGCGTIVKVEVMP